MRCSAVVLFYAVTAIGLCTRASFVRHEKRNIDHDYNWSKTGRAQGHTRVPVRIALTQRNLERGHDLLMDVAEPNSPNYGQHWTSAQVTEMFSPSQGSVDVVSAWLSASGIDVDRHAVSPGQHWIKFDASLEEVEGLLRTEYRIFRHKQSGDEHLACDEYHVPHDVHPHIDYISPTIKMTPVSPKHENIAPRNIGSLAPIDLGPSNAPDTNSGSRKGVKTDPSMCYKGVDPSCLKLAYGIPDAPAHPQTDNELGIFESGYKYDQQDLDEFWQKFYPTIPQGTGPVLKSVYDDNPTDSQPPANETTNFEESLLDFEIAFPLVYPQKVWLYQVGTFPNETFLDVLDYFLDAVDASYCKNPDQGGYNKTKYCGTYKPTSVLSMSYGFQEHSFTPAEEIRQCNEYMKLGLQGVTVVYASGDAGVAGKDGCLPGQRFNPGFPASCPYVTSVGATMVKNGSNVTDQVPASDPDLLFHSGGGFSDVFTQPDYQNDAVRTFLTDHKPPYPDSTYNASGRGFPDISALGQNIVVRIGGQWVLRAGTSASTPIVASIINLINDARLEAGKSTVGFINPVLYANPEAFTDITTGNNPGCGTDGFSAVKGWDPVTGLGTPRFDDLLNVFMALP